IEDIRRRFNPIAMTMTFGILFPRRHTCGSHAPRLGHIFKVHKSLYMYIP
ncbi:unnamed protein product, partial [Brassica oleracea]